MNTKETNENIMYVHKYSRQFIEKNKKSAEPLIIDRTKQKGITLVSLVVTIIVVLILVGITLGGVSSKNGIVNRAEEAREGAEIAQYKEMIQTIIVEKQVERSKQRKKPKALIEMVAEEIDNRDWSENVEICDDDENPITPPSQGTKIIVETVEGYEIIVDMEADPISIGVVAGGSETVTIMFDLNGGNGTLPAEITKKLGRNITLPNGEGLSKSGKKLMGWSENPNENALTGKYYSLGDKFTVTKTTTLYAVWGDDIVEVTFDGNNATSGTMDKIRLIRGGTENLTSNNFTRTGYKFVGWNTKPNGTGTSYANGASITVADDITIYAMWEEIVTLGSISPATLDLKMGEKGKLTAKSTQGTDISDKVTWTTNPERNC